MFTSQDDRYPAIFNAEAPHPGTSSRYRFLPTSALLEALKPQGFEIADMSQGRSKSPYARHTVTLTHPDMPFVEVAPGDRVQFRVVILNSHDASKRLVLHAGAFRSFCFNGMVFGSLESETIKVAHNATAPALDNFIEGVFQVVARTKGICETMRAMTQKQLSANAARHFALQAHALRWPDPAKAPTHPDALLEARREQDLGGSLWLTYQRVQENLLKGGQIGRTQTNRPHTTRAVNSAVNGVRINAGLWSLATQYLEAA